MQNQNRLIILGSLGVALWGTVVWLFVAMPLFIIELLPALLPISVFAFLLFVIGLLLLTIVAASVVRLMAPRYAWTVILTAASLIVLYNLSPLAPAWKCYSKRLYVATVNAAGQNCTTTCTNNKKKPCGGWSSCWDKDISCSSAGRDQDGRPCQGCCFSCTVVCEDPDYFPVSYLPSGASPYGALNMAGNAWEWVADWYDPDYYSNSPRSNSKGSATGDRHILRGGGWNMFVEEVVLSYHREAESVPGGYQLYSIGFRCAKEVP